MILRRYGTTYKSVRPRFDSRSMTEIGFTKDGALSLDVAEFERKYDRHEGLELSPTATGTVQADVEHALLEMLTAGLAEIEDGLDAGQILVVESEPGIDHPRTRGKHGPDPETEERERTFRYSVDPPLRVGIYVSR